MAHEIIGRDDELSSIRAFVERAHDGPRAVVLEGEPGIGKSTLWLAGVERACSQGLRILSARPAEAERGLAHAGLGDLFEDVLDDVLPSLSPPRRRALEGALLLKEASSEAVDPRALGVAVRDALEVLAERGPPVLAIDDLQWLDAASAGALAFALRRVDASPLLLLLAQRLADGAQQSPLERSLAEENVERLSLGPLSVGALHAFLRDRLDRVFARQTLLRIHEQSGGNPFFALELARALGAEVDPTQPLPVPQTLEGLVRVRLAGLPATTRDALAVAAALGAPSQSLLERAGIGAHALDAAFDARVIERDNGALRFTHPLLSSVVYADLVRDRRTVHRRIAEIVEDPPTRARHLALATEAANDEVAAVLDEAARTATDRGAAAVAAELAEHALRLTPVGDPADRHRRALAAARAQHAAGEWTRAKTIAGELLAESDIGPLRADALVVLAELEPLERASALLEEALDEAASRPALRSRIHCKLAWATRFTKGFVGALDHARAALELAEEVDDDALRIEALGMLAFLGSAVGDVDALAHAQRAYELARAAGDVRLQAASAPVDAYEVTDVNAARALLEREYRASQEQDEPTAAMILHNLALVELSAGRWQIAADYAAQAYEITIQYGLEAPWNHVPIATIAAHRGQLDLARAHSELGLRLGEEQMGLHTPVHLGTMGVVALQSGDPGTAAKWFAEAEAETTRLGWRGPGHRWWLGDHVEALLALDRIDDAVRVLDTWDADALRLQHDRALAHVKRCRGLVAAARGDVAEAASLLAAAVAQHERVGDAFGRARALVALGSVRRRERQKRAARDAIEAALAGFEQLGAATWSERARSELGRIGGRTREEGLTAAERRVAALVAEGRTNREVATALFLTENTVERHLSHAYAKLGVRSRTELARTFPADEQSLGEPGITS
jgi:DNA-binding CsgD family transcriptional regulator